MSYQRPWPKLGKYITKFGFTRHKGKLMIQIDVDSLVPRQVEFYLWVCLCFFLLYRESRFGDEGEVASVWL